MHTRNREEHEYFRRAQEAWFRILSAEFFNEHPEVIGDSGIITSLNQRAWDKAIEQLGGSAEGVEVPEKPLPKHAITEKTICPKTNKTVEEQLCNKCLDRAAVGSSAAIKYFVCMELKRRK